MTDKARAIPAVEGVQDFTTSNILGAIKETVEKGFQRRGSRTAPLPTSATTAQIIAKINELIDRIRV